MLFGIGFYSFLIGTLTSVLTTMDAKKTQLNHNLKEIEIFGDDFNVPKNLLKKMKKAVNSSPEEVMD